MNLYENMMPKEAKQGKIGYYPVTNEKEWDELPDLYKVMEWEPVADPHNKDKLRAVKAVIFDVTFMQPYGISARVYVHPQEVQKILFCSFKENDCHLYSVCGIELEGGTMLPAKWVQDSFSGSFAILYSGNYIGMQGGFRGYIPEHIQCLNDGTFKFDFQYGKGKTAHYALGNPFSHLPEKYIWETKGDLAEQIQSASFRAVKSNGIFDSKAKESER